MNWSKIDINTTFITGDWQFGRCFHEAYLHRSMSPEELMLYRTEDRPFETAEEEFEKIRDNHNRVVKPNDLVIVVGYPIYQAADRDWFDRLHELNGQKVLVRGPHERSIPDEDLQKYFCHIVGELKGIDLTVNKDKVGKVDCYITYYPHGAKKDKFNLVACAGSAWKYQLNMMNVGVDANHFRPIPLTDIEYHLEAIQKLFNQDHFAAYYEANACHLGTRSKLGHQLSELRPQAWREAGGYELEVKEAIVYNRQQFHVEFYAGYYDESKTKYPEENKWMTFTNALSEAAIMEVNGDTVGIQAAIIHVPTKTQVRWKH